MRNRCKEGERGISGEEKKGTEKDTSGNKSNNKLKRKRNHVR